MELSSLCWNLPSSTLYSLYNPRQQHKQTCHKHRPSSLGRGEKWGRTDTWFIFTLADRIT